MNPESTRRSRRRRAWTAAGLAVAVVVHVALLSVMGLIRPRFEARSPDDGPDVQLQLLPQLVPRGSEPITANARQARRDALAASPLAELVEPSPAPSPAGADNATPSPAPVATANDISAGKGGGDCDPEDLPLLAPAEKVRCANQLEVARARRARALDDAGRADRMATVRALPHVDGIPVEKRAHYDAVAAAEKAVREDFSTWMPWKGHRIEDFTNPKIVKPAIHDVVNCTLKFGANKGKPQGSRFGLKVGGFDCPLQPPPGFLTEEARINPP